MEALPARFLFVNKKITVVTNTDVCLKFVNLEELDPIVEIMAYTIC